MLIWAKMGYNIISNISRILRILYHIIYPTKRYNIRYRYAKTYIFPTTVNRKIANTSSPKNWLFVVTYTACTIYLEARWF